VCADLDARQVGDLAQVAAVELDSSFQAPGVPSSVARRWTSGEVSSPMRKRQDTPSADLRRMTSRMSSWSNRNVPA